MVAARKGQTFSGPFRQREAQNPSPRSLGDCLRSPKCAGSTPAEILSKELEQPITPTTQPWNASTAASSEGNPAGNPPFVSEISRASFHFRSDIQLHLGTDPIGPQGSSCSWGGCEGDRRQDLRPAEKSGSRYSAASYLTNAGIPVWVDTKVAIAHNKVMVIDGATVITGSFNFTAAAQKSNAENLLVLNDPSLAAEYTANWERRRAASERYRGALPPAMVIEAE